MFKFKGISSDEMKIIVEEEDKLIGKTSHKYESIEKYGSFGNNYIESGLNDKEINLKIYILDNNNQIVKISNNKMKIRIVLPEDLKGFDKYEVVYILDDEIKETIPATVDDGYIVFETSHLSQYGIVATNVEEKTEQVKNETNNPKTGDNITTSVILFVASISTIGTLIVINRKKVRE